MAERHSLGKWGEQIVADYLVAEGYAIVQRNWRLNHLEVDIIATRGDEIAFVEVKARRNDGVNPLEAVNRRKIMNMVNAANAYLKACKVQLRPRFDVAAVIGEPHQYRLEYIRDAFLPPLRTYR